jgi:hypothetical protein
LKPTQTPKIGRYQGDADWFAPEIDGGALVPAEALDPDKAFDATHADALIDRFLRGLDPSANEFLATAADLVELDFKGTPYRLVHD